MAQLKHYAPPETLYSTFMAHVLPSLKIFRSPKFKDEVCITGVINKFDALSQSHVVHQVRRTEIHNFLKSGTIKILLKEEVT